MEYLTYAEIKNWWNYQKGQKIKYCRCDRCHQIFKWKVEIDQMDHFVVELLSCESGCLPNPNHPLIFNLTSHFFYQYFIIHPENFKNLN